MGKRGEEKGLCRKEGTREREGKKERSERRGSGGVGFDIAWSDL